MDPRILVGLALSILLCTACKAGKQGTKDEESVTLWPGIERTARHTPGQKEHFAIAGLRLGDYLEVSLWQSECDLQLSVQDNTGAVIALADRVAGGPGREFWAFAIGPSLVLPLTAVVSSEFPQCRDSYRILATTRIPSLRDKRVADAYAALAEGGRLRKAAGDALPGSKQAFETAASEFLDLGLPQLSCDAVEGVGRVLDLMGDNVASASLRLKNLSAQSLSGDVLGQIRSHYGLGRVYTSTGEIQLSIEHYEKGLELCQLEKIPVLEGMIGHNLGDLFLELGELSRAQEHLAASRRVFEEKADRHKVAIETVSLSQIALELGNELGAAAHLNKAEELLRELNMVWDLGRLLQLQSALQSKVPHTKADAKRASELLVEALRLNRKAGDKRGELVSLRLLGASYGGEERYERASEILQRALLLAEEMKEYVEKPGILRSLGETAFALENYSQSKVYLDNARKLAKEYGLAAEEAQILAGIAKVYRATGDSETSLNHAKAAIVLLESVRNRIVSVGDRTTYFNSLRPMYDLYLDLLMDDSEKRGVVAFAVSEQARARTLSEYLAHQGRSVGDAGGRDIRIAALRLRSAEQQGASLRASGNATSAELLASEAEIASRFREFQQLTQVSAIPVDLASDTQARLEALQKEIPSDTLLLEYAVTGEWVYAWALGEKELTPYRLGRSADILGVVRQIRMDIEELKGASENARETIRARIGALTEKASKFLLAPIAISEGIKGLAIVPDSILHGLPFSFLPAPANWFSGQKPGKLLIDRFELSMMPAAAMLVQNPVARGWTKEIAVLSDPVFSSGDGRVDSPRPGETQFARLRFTKLESDAIKRLVPSAEVATGFAANQDFVLSGALKPYRIVHFATHAILNELHPELSSIVLSQVNRAGESVDGMLRLHEIYGLELSAELVVLSACESALGKEIRGEGYIGLTRAFLSGGAAAVMSSLWQVDDKASAELMNLFYTALLEQKRTPAEALQMAQNSMRNDPRWSSPYFWAAFHIVTRTL